MTRPTATIPADVAAMLASIDAAPLTIPMAPWPYSPTPRPHVAPYVLPPVLPWTPREASDPMRTIGWTDQMEAVR